MKSIVVHPPGGLDRIELIDRPDPGQPGPGEIRVAIHASSLNFHDLAVAAGKMPLTEDRVLMSDGAGIVEAVGPGVTEFKPGDRVVSCFFPQWSDGLPIPEVGDFSRTPGDGVDGFAVEHAVRPATAFTLAPTAWTHQEAATITTAGLTAWRALVADAHLKAGDVVLTLGTGGVSIAALQLAKLFGAAVIVTSSSDEKLERAKALGANHTINYRQHENWGAKVLDCTNGRGADHVLELGGPGTLPQSIEAVRVGGHISLIGVHTGFAGQIPTGTLMRKHARLQGLIVGNRRQQQDYVTALNQAPFRPVIDRTFSFPDLAKAFAYQATASHFGKICVEW